MVDQIRVEDERLLFTTGARTETLRGAVPYVVTWKSPTASDIVPILTTDARQLEILAVDGFRSGGTSVQIQIYQGTNVSSGTELTDGTFTFSATSLTSMDMNNDFVGQLVPANSICWVVIGTVSGTVNVWSATLWCREVEY